LSPAPNTKRPGRPRKPATLRATPEPPDTTPPAPPPPSGDAVAAALIAVASGAVPVEAWPVRADEPLDRQQVWAGNGWRFAFWWQLGVLHRLAVALAPGGGRWEYGCGRWPDWTAGPDAVVLDPIHHLLTPEQHAQLQARLLECPQRLRPAVPEYFLRPWPSLNETFPPDEDWLERAS
jgi:hypothetical protein